MSKFGKIQSMLIDSFSGPRIVFLHVPKCAGTSVSRALRIRYPLSFGGFQAKPVYSAFETLFPTEDYDSIAKRVSAYREAQLLHYLFNDVRCISGHVRYSNTAFQKFGEKYRFLTTLRNPVSLMISYYNFASEVGVERWQLNSSFDAFLNSERARTVGSMYSSFFSGLPPEADPRARESIDQAKRNLRNFAVVGFVEDLHGFQKLLREAVGIRLLLGHKNQSRGGARERNDTTPADVRRKIEDLSSANMEIYEFAQKELSSGLPV